MLAFSSKYLYIDDVIGCSFSCAGIASGKTFTIGKGVVIMSNNNNQKEIWQDVKEFDGIYQISNFGRLKSFKVNSQGRILSNINKKGDYLSVVLTTKKKVRYVRLHVLVAEAFLSKPLNKREINHKDCNKQNNNVNNLEWVTKKENYWHARENGLTNFEGMIFYNRYIKANPVMQYNMNNKYLKTYRNCKIASDISGVCHRNIHQVAAKEEYKPGKTRQQAGGYIWKFVKEY